VIPDPLDIAALHDGYRAGTFTPADIVRALLGRIDAYPDPAVFITRTGDAAAAQAAALDIADLETMPLWGIPFVVKDNIDVAGLPTTAGCPDFAYTPDKDATIVARLRAAGAILMGKTNLDQFATGLNGTRSPYGAPRSVFSPDHCAGGSSSGSAVAQGAGLCVFALGTDTAGSGRVPAAFNNVVGLKPSLGRLPTTGIVPACRTLDCPSIFANSTADALAVLRVAQGVCPGDAYSRAAGVTVLPAAPRVGILRAADRFFADDAANAALYDAALRQAASRGWALVEFDYAPFRQIAEALYGRAPVAERYAAIKPFFDAKPDSLHPVVRSIIAGAKQFSAADAYADLYRIADLRAAAEQELAGLDLLLLPTAPTQPRVDAMLADPIALNAVLGHYTNFVNFMDLAAISIPAGFTTDPLPFGVTMIAARFTEPSLAFLAGTLHRALGAGATKTRAQPLRDAAAPAHEATLVVAGAHLSGMALNPELLALGAQLIATTRTASGYKLYALETKPPKPGLVRCPSFDGPGIEVELYGLSFAAFGTFVTNVPQPMCMGKITLADGTQHPGFLCEPHALNGAEGITHFGGWRAYRESLAPAIAR
jgi:allophanate hydrolase